MFEWAADRALPARPDDQPLPSYVSIETLKRLSEDATSDVQRAACGGIIDEISKRIEMTIQNSTGRAGTDLPPEPDTPVLTALAGYVESSRGTRAASAAAESLVYENGVLKALMLLSLQNEGLTFRREPPNGKFDGLVEVNGRRIAIEIRWSRDVNRIRASIDRFVQSISYLPHYADAVLLITPFEVEAPEVQFAHFVSATWRSPVDNPGLLAGLLLAGTTR